MVSFGFIEIPFRILRDRTCSFYTNCLLENAELDVPEQRWRPLEEGSKGSFRGSAALLFELEDKVAQAAASVQSAQSEVIKVNAGAVYWWQELLTSAGCPLRCPT